MTQLVAANPIPIRSRARLASFVMLVAGVLATGMIGLLIFSTALQDQTFELNDKRSQAASLANELASLEAQLASANSVTSLAAKAQDLGMRPNPYPAQLVLPTGEVVGDPKPVYGREVPGATYRTPEEQEAYHAEVEAKAKAKKEAAAKKKAEEKAKKAAEEAAKKQVTGTD
jgi:hypothetical protein